jgi:hypothetical protein
VCLRRTDTDSPGTESARRVNNNYNMFYIDKNIIVIICKDKEEDEIKMRKIKRKKDEDSPLLIIINHFMAIILGYLS